MGLPRLSNVAKNYVVKKKVYNAKIKLIQDKIPDITNLTTNASFSAEINEVKGETLNITNSATNIALTAVENKIPDVINLVKKLTITQKLMKLKINLLMIMIMINILLLKNLIS